LCFSPCDLSDHWDLSDLSDPCDPSDLSKTSYLRDPSDPYGIDDLGDWGDCTIDLLDLSKFCDLIDPDPKIDPHDLVIKWF
jgi:hypothetical protein